MPQKRAWRIRTHDTEETRRFARTVGVQPVVAQLLLCRGLSDARLARDFLDAKLSTLRLPEELPGAAAAAEQIHAAIQAKKRICVYGDYDVDGMTGAALLYKALKLLCNEAPEGPPQIHYHIPSRLEEGYGLNSETLRKLKSQGTDMVVTVDCGITAVAEAETARDLGLELVISDHHTFAEALPNATLVHPGLPGTAYPFLGLSGSGVALKLAWAVCKRASGATRVSERMRDYLLQAVGYAALGTVADVVPLVDENRVLVRHGLIALRERPTVGMKHLLRVCKLDDGRMLASDDLGFMIAPRLNAAGRFGQALLGVELLTTENEERAAQLAEYIHELNASRQTLERSIQLAAGKQAEEEFDPENDPALVLAGRQWHAGVIGIVAGRLAEKFHRPVVLLSLDGGDKPAVGSARSVPGVDLCAALSSCKERLVKFGGHAMAAGLTIEESQIDAFRAEFCERIAGERSGDAAVPDLVLDGEAPLAAFTREVVDECDKLAPFGCGNVRPIWCTSQAVLVEPPKKMGGGERHLSLKVQQGAVRLRAVSFGNAEWADDMAACRGPMDLAFRPVLNNFRGMTSVELHVVDWRPSAPSG